MKSAVILILFSFSLLYGQDNFSGSKRSIHELTSYSLDENKTPDFLRVKHTYLADTLKRKNVLLGAALSALLPGAGEYYAKSYIKAAIFFGIEAAAWGAHFYFNHKGNVQTDNFQNYANTYWSIRKYATWLRDQVPGCGGINPDEPNIDVLVSS